MLRIRAKGCLVVLAMALASLAGAADLPTLKAGLWLMRSNLRGPMPPRCTDPTLDRERDLKARRALKCSVSDVVQEGTVWRYGVSCPMGRKTLHADYRIAAASDAVYREEIETSTDGGPGNLGAIPKEIVDAKRIGDCTP